MDSSEHASKTDKVELFAKATALVSLCCQKALEDQLRRSHMVVNVADQMDHLFQLALGCLEFLKSAM